METLALDTLYQIKPVGQNASIEVIGGTVDVFGSYVQPSSPPTDMDKTAENFVGIDNFGSFPDFIYITQRVGTTTKILLSGFNAEVVP